MARIWGPESDGFALSAVPNALTIAADDSLRISIALKNTRPAPARIEAGSWLTFFHLRIEGPDGDEAMLNSFGRR